MTITPFLGTIIGIVIMVVLVVFALWVLSVFIAVADAACNGLPRLEKSITELHTKLDDLKRALEEGKGNG